MKYDDITLEKQRENVHKRHGTEDLLEELRDIERKMEYPNYMG